MTDYADMPTHELRQIVKEVQAELDRRTVLETASAQMERLMSQVLEAEGVEDGGPWVDTLHGYPEGFTVTHSLPDSTAIGTWVNVRPGNRYAPGSPGGGWVLQAPDEDTPPLWVKPAWAEVGYAKDDLVTFPTYEEGAVYRSLLDKNTWSPSEYPEGWERLGGEQPDPDPEEPGDTYPVWVRPVWGAEEGGAYPLGARVHYPTETDPVYESIHDGWNTWAPDGPGAFGWVQV